MKCLCASHQDTIVSNTRSYPQGRGRAQKKTRQCQYSVISQTQGAGLPSDLREAVKDGYICQ